MLLIILAIGLIQTEWGQNWIVGLVTSRLSNDLQSRISIKHIDIGFFNRMNLDGVLVEDQKKDTLLWAGTVHVRITDWFFLSDKAELEYIGLENAVIKLQRTDSVWNYHYLEEYFASPGSNKKKKAGIEFNLKEVELKNVSFLQKDAWTGSDMLVRVKGMNLTARDLNFSNKIIDIARLDLTQPYFQLYDYTGLRPDSLKPHHEKINNATNDSLQWNVQNWKINVNALTLKNGTFKNDQQTDRPVYAYFDDKHIEFNAINGQIKNLQWQKDTISAQIDLSTRERSGLVAQALKADYRFHPQMMEFKNLYLKTNRSVLGNYFAMKFKDLSNLNDFIAAVTMEGHFKNAAVASDDIAFFAPQIKDWNRIFKIDGKVTGTVDDLSGQEVTIQTGNTYFSGDATIVGLPDVNSTYFNLKANRLRSTYTDAADLVPSIRKITTPDIRSLSYVNFTGNFTGFINDFVLYGVAQTNLGTLSTDLNMKLPEGRPPVYSGSVATNSFQLGKFINSPQLGMVAFKGNVKGKSFQWKTLDMNIDGTIHKIQYGGYTYQNITAKGRLNKRLFDGDFVIKDTNADLHLKGIIDLSGAQPSFNAHADIAYAHLKNLQLSREDLQLKGVFDVDFTGNNLNDFLGSARISKATLLQNGKPLLFDSLVLTSHFINGEKRLNISSNELEATITGKFDLQALPDAFMLFLNRYYPSYIPAPKKAMRPQSFTFDIHTGDVEDYIKLLDKRLSGFNNSHVFGSLDIATNTLNVQADVPQFGINQYQFSDVKIKGDGNFDRLIVTGQVNNAIVTDSLNFPQTDFYIQAKNDVSDISINTTANQTINQASLSAQVRTFSNGFKLLLNPSSFVLNGKTWNIEQGGELDFRKNAIVHGQVVLRETAQEIRLSTHPSEIGDWNDLLVSLNNINLGDISPLLMKSDRIEGLLSGEVHVEDPQHRFNVTTTLRTEQLRVDNDSIGQVRTSLYYNNQTGLLTGEGSNVDPDHKILFDLALDFKDSANTHRDRITIQPTNYPVKILERFIGFLFSDLQGYVTGKLDILGEGANRDYVGKASLKNAGLKVNFTQVFYKIDDTQIELKADEINFGTMKLRDRFGNTATVRGKIKHKGFRNMQFDILAQVVSPQMELLNTTYNDNQTFYGTAMGKGQLVLVGPENDMLMNIDVTASQTDSSYIILPPSRSRESGIADFMIEKKYGREMTEEELSGTASNITYMVNLNANPLVNIEVILDELTGDIIKGRGTGNLRINSGTNEPLTLRGRYDIQDGNYLFTFQSFFKKPFILRPGSNNYIEWTGDPYGANIHIDAVYRAEKVSFAPLVSGLALNKNLTTYRGDVNVVASLTGELFKPKIGFQLEVVDNNILNTDPTLPFALQQIEKNPNELSKQVSGLIVFNSFYPFENTQSSSFRPFDEFAYSTISGLLFGEVNKRLNELLSKILRNNELTVNFTGSVYNRNLVDQGNKGFSINQSNLNISVGRSFFDNRFNITFGSTFDVPLQANIQQNIQFLPDVTAEWLINKSGTIRASFFYRQNLDFLNGTTIGTGLRTKRTGANISYRREYDSISEFFFGKKEKPKTPPLPLSGDSATTASPDKL